METRYLYCKAPFAAFRWFQAGTYRATSPVIPHSTAWGLVLNIAAIDVRDTSTTLTTSIRSDAPELRIAVGRCSCSQTTTLYQQLHSYPVGNSGKKDLKPLAKGAKYWISPVRRELLVGLECVVGIQGDEGILERITAGLRGEFNHERYGLPFAGDNNLLFDNIGVDNEPPPTSWYCPVTDDEQRNPDSCRLTIGIDREDSSQTRSVLFAPTDELMTSPPESAWVWTPSGPNRFV